MTGMAAASNPHARRKLRAAGCTPGNFGKDPQARGRDHYVLAKGLRAGLHHLLWFLAAICLGHSQPQEGVGSADAA